jgi:hypothetical protein
MVLDDLCLFPAKFCCVILQVRNFESYMQIADMCVPVKLASSVEKYRVSIACLKEFRDVVAIDMSLHPSCRTGWSAVRVAAGASTILFGVLVIFVNLFMRIPGYNF